MNRNVANNSARGGGSCMCLAFVLAMFGALSPYWVWNYGWNLNGTTSTVGTGTLVVSASSNQFRCGWWSTCIVTKQWNEFDDFNGTACEAPYFDEFGKYGFCDGGEGGSFQRPGKVNTIRALAITTTVFLFIGTILSCVSPSAGGSRAGFAAAACSLIAMCTSCAAFAVATTFDWYNDLRRGAVSLPFIASTTECGDSGCLFLQNEPNRIMNWGPAFWSFVTVFILTVCTTTSLFAAAKSLDEDTDLDGSYGSGSGQYGAADDFAYGSTAAKNA
ncbi:Hypothetical Protein FCC1311_074042 [Hondaea fermentalgiana]|uniref:Uncharacterized protein n=1 Tax=Hondaea fermentalgiana TaxID=2315210 RepID=A0A2R5GRC2_9STRA|nr:Hypothetical Protein FCC1311_074042 [Hondaea fermentalgiana]|eukprot:GBG31183.1 Hypothetical Protein FCC1311_074042 [Hondaea fermentalgiana]